MLNSKPRNELFVTLTRVDLILIKHDCVLKINDFKLGAIHVLKNYVLV